ncbi:GerMN domain-containing protein [Veillonella caviae]|uniref:GerMN domain-containing protein n=1 Tax=Veillonella caviae TaxID=248316 RepID=UPI0023F1EF53|nr:GerMN domain-containing protein [Veillonella caviae]MCI6407584.1 GerMN domain-containing protein [Veillonella caviae]
MLRNVKLISITLLAVMMLVMAGCSSIATDSAEGNKQAVTTSAESQSTKSADKDTMAKMVVYVPRDDGKGVRPQTITVDSDKKTLKYAISFLFDEDSRQSYPIFPKNVTVKDVAIKDGIARINLSKEFLEGGNIDGLSAQLRLASIVNTATSFDAVKKVQLLVNSETIKTYGGYDVSEPMSRMEQQIVK